jgi:hypothetical protein
MTDSPAELFTHDGTAEQVSVKPGDGAEAPSSTNVIFVPLVEQHQSISLAPPVETPEDKHTAVSSQPVRLPYRGIFSARIAKVKQVTADIFSQIRELKFTDQ